MDCRCAVAITPNCYITSKSGFVKSFAKRGFGPFGEVSDFLSTLKEIISGKVHFIDNSNECGFIYVRAQSFLKHGVRQNHFLTFCLLQCIIGSSSPRIRKTLEAWHTFELEKHWRLGTTLLPSMLTIIQSRFLTSIAFFLRWPNTACF